MCLNLRVHKIYRHCVRYFSLWIMSDRQNQLEWKNHRDTDRSRLLCRPPFSLENQHTTEPRCSVVSVYAARLCAGRLGGVEGHPWYIGLLRLKATVIKSNNHIVSIWVENIRSARYNARDILRAWSRTCMGYVKKSENVQWIKSHKRSFDKQIKGQNTIELSVTHRYLYFTQGSLYWMLIAAAGVMMDICPNNIQMIF